MKKGENRPLVDAALDAVEDRLEQTPDCSEATTTVVPVGCTSTRAVVYSNSNPVDPIIIIENKTNQNCPEMGLDTAEGSGCHKRGTQETTVATTVAGAEQTTRTGQRYNQISSSSEDAVILMTSEEEETSPEYSHFGETVKPTVTVDPGLTTRINTCDGVGRLTEGWMTTEYGEDDRTGTSEECSMEGSSSGPAVCSSAEVEKYVKERSENRLSPGAGTVSDNDEVSRRSRALDVSRTQNSSARFMRTEKRKRKLKIGMELGLITRRPIIRTMKSPKLKSMRTLRQRTMKSPEIQQQEVL